MNKIYNSLPFNEYQQMYGEHAGSLKDILTTPLLYHWNQTHPDKKETDQMKIGKAVHASILEPDEYSVAIWPAENGRRHGEKWNDFLMQNKDAVVLTEDQNQEVLLITKAIKEHVVVKNLFQQADSTERAEVSLFWDDLETKLQCKGRVDLLLPDCIVELKTTRHVQPIAFAADAARRGYFFQTAFYNTGAEANCLGNLPIKIIAVQNIPPYDVVVYDVAESDIIEGRKQIRQALDTLALCQTTGKWPGHAPLESLPLYSPPWTFHSDEELEDVA